MEVVEEDIVIVGAGIAGLTTALGLHRLGIRSLVLESSEFLRVTGFAFTTWTNAWRALDAIGIGDSLRRQHNLLNGGEHEVRCVRRKLLLEALEKKLPIGTIKYSSKVVSIEESGCFKLVHVADGSVLRTKVLIGCDGVNSVVAKWLGFNKAAFVGRSAIRGYADFKGSHGFGTTFLQFFGNGVRSGFLPCNDTTVYWFFTFTPSTQDKEVEETPAKMKEFVLSKLGKVPDQVRAVVEITELDDIICSPLRFRHPWDLLWGNISKGSVCVAGDALHPMTPDIGQGGCVALEDGVVLARCLGPAFTEKHSEGGEKDEYKKIEMGLKKFARERRWRGFELISTAYMVGVVQQSEGVVMNFLRDKIFAAFLAGLLLLKKADFDCGKLCIS
ncbi:FAD/NAD(P)-binding oxidoreductase family protein [Actinidia rufa]|uniref:FAD/NAD(P)-binding oxidoreductase family protein n=1 Tax=Actinidia rufa TaxID=165716 RepID=A0A7J0FPM1_9ERIC|nr:FAD/NAD(P)-binding oxidoreductase family protein [Actinidia rufa]